MVELKTAQGRENREKF